jgi:hypothetical protein
MNANIYILTVPSPTSAAGCRVNTRLVRCRLADFRLLRGTMVIFTPPLRGGWPRGFWTCVLATPGHLRTHTRTRTLTHTALSRLLHSLGVGVSLSNTVSCSLFLLENTLWFIPRPLLLYLFVGYLHFFCYVKIYNFGCFPSTVITRYHLNGFSEVSNQSCK